MSTTGEKVVHEGGCHCGAVKWQARAPADLTVIECNCSVCRKKQLKSCILPASDFTLIQGADKLTVYEFNTRQAQHPFCSQCGVQSYYRPRSNAVDGIAIMLHCIDSDTVRSSAVRNFDGKNWKKSMEKEGAYLRSFSKSGSNDTSAGVYGDSSSAAAPLIPGSP